MTALYDDSVSLPPVTCCAVSLYSTVAAAAAAAVKCLFAWGELWASEEVSAEGASQRETGKDSYTVYTGEMKGKDRRRKRKVEKK